MDYPESQCANVAGGLLKQCESPSILDTLKRKQAQHQERLDAVTAAIKALEENPQVAKVMELVAKAR